MQNVTVLKSYHKQALASAETDQDLSDKIEDINNEIKLEGPVSSWNSIYWWCSKIPNIECMKELFLARKVRSKLKSMKSEVNQTPQEEKGSFDDRCTKGHCMALAKAFASAMKIYQDEQKDYQ